MPTAKGQPATFQFWNLSPSTSYTVALTSGASYTGAVFQTGPVIANLKVARGQLSFETVPSDSQWLSGAVVVGLIVSRRTFGGSANIAPPVVLQVECLGSTATQADTFSIDTGIDFPPTCVLCGAGPEAGCPQGMKLCGYMGHFFCCQDCPYDEPR